MDINEQWSQFLTESNIDGIVSDTINAKQNTESVPCPTPIHISTKTKIAYITNETNDLKLDILSVFWNIPIISYTQPTCGIVKKQIIIKSTSEEELNKIQAILSKIPRYEELIITSINNPEGRIKFKDKRKISIGINKKDIVSSRRKKKSAFDNCFVLILRLTDDILGFKEYHVKVFNTGKIEIPGVKEDDVFNNILYKIIQILSPHVEDKLYYQMDNNMEVLINSNFNCGFYIKRDVLFKLLKYKYNIPTIYDSCMYPGIQCKYEYELCNADGTKTIKKISFMIFRTGSVLIMGKCEERVLHEMYKIVTNILIDEYNEISQGNCTEEIVVEPKIKTKKNKKQIILINENK